MKKLIIILLLVSNVPIFAKPKPTTIKKEFKKAERKSGKKKLLNYIMLLGLVAAVTQAAKNNSN